MRAIEYGLVTLIIGGLVIWGATTLSAALAQTFNHTAAQIDRR